MSQKPGGRELSRQGGRGGLKMQSVAVVSRRRLPRRRADDARGAGSPTASLSRALHAGCGHGLVQDPFPERPHLRPLAFGDAVDLGILLQVDVVALEGLQTLVRAAPQWLVAPQACRNGREAHTPRGALPPAYDSLRSAFATPNWHPLNCVSALDGPTAGQATSKTAPGSRAGSSGNDVQQGRTQRRDRRHDTDKNPVEQERNGRLRDDN